MNRNIPKQTYNVCTWNRSGGASVERVRKTYNGLLDWAEAILHGSRATHIDVGTRHKDFTLAHVGGKLTRTDG